MKVNKKCIGIWLWVHNDEKNYLALATDDILIA